MTLFTSCDNDNNENVNKQTYSSVINSRALDSNGGVVFSQGTAKVEINYTDMTIQFAVDYKDADGIGRNLNTPTMKMTSKVGSTYSITGSQSGTNILGEIDLASGMMIYTLEDASGTIISTTHLLFAYATTQTTNPDNGYNYNHQQSAYLFIPNPDGKTCSMRISNFSPNIAGSVEVSDILYENLTMTPTEDGYTITAGSTEPTNAQGHYEITDLEVTIDNQCRYIDGTFNCNDLQFKVSGDLFPRANSL